MARRGGRKDRPGAIGHPVARAMVPREAADVLALSIDRRCEQEGRSGVDEQSTGDDEPPRL